MHGIQKRLARLYGEDRAGAMAARIDAMLAVHKGKKQPAHDPKTNTLGGYAVHQNRPCWADCFKGGH